CKKFVAAGKTYLVYQGGDSQNGLTLPMALASSDVIGADPKANVERQLGKFTFSSSPLWHRVMEHFLDLKANSCFETGVQGVNQVSALALFAKGDSGGIAIQTGALGAILALNPSFTVGLKAMAADK